MRFTDPQAAIGTTRVQTAPAVSDPAKFASEVFQAVDPTRWSVRRIFEQIDTLRNARVQSWRADASEKIEQLALPFHGCGAAQALNKGRARVNMRAA